VALFILASYNKDSVTCRDPAAAVLRFAQNIAGAFRIPTRAKLLARFGDAQIKTPPEGGVIYLGVPKGIRTPVTAVKEK
jgi:hypothetical protein